MNDVVAAEPRTEFEVKSSNFVRWFENANGTRLSSKIKLADHRADGGGRAVDAVQDINEDEELFAIPRSLVLATSTSSIPSHILEALKDTGNWPPLMVTIIFEYLRGKSSPWHSYFEVLPTSFETLMFWKPTELAELQASAVVSKVGKEDAEEDWKNTIIPVMLENPDLFPLKGHDKASRTDELIKLTHMAGSLIMAYAFDIDDDTKEKQEDEDESDEFEEDNEDEPIKGMVPFADMLNADADRNNARLFQEDDYLIMKATKPIPANHEIFNDYGPLPRSDLLRMYGYTTDRYAKYDVVEFDHSLVEKVAGSANAKSAEDWQKRKITLDELGLIDDGYALQRPEPGVTLENYLPGQLHMLLRGLCMTENSIKAPKINPNESISIQEVALLSAVLTKRLSDYPTTVQEDTNIMDGLRAGENVEIPVNVHRNRYQMAIEVRKGEKEILLTLLQLCQDHIRNKTREIATSSSTKRKREGDTIAQAKTAKTKRV